MEEILGTYHMKKLLERNFRPESKTPIKLGVTRISEAFELINPYKDSNKSSIIIKNYVYNHNKKTIA